MKRSHATLVALLFAAALSACGGGGGGGAAATAASNGSAAAGSSGSTVSGSAADTGSAGAAGTGGFASGGGIAGAGGTITVGTSTSTSTSANASGALPSPAVTGTGAGTVGSTPAPSGSTLATGPTSGTTSLAVSSPGTGPRTLVLFDAPAGSEWEKLGFSYAVMLRNLLGHFDAQVDLLPVQQYTAGRMQSYAATFYLGAAYNNPIPAAFLADAATTTRTLVWFKYNLWELASDPQYAFAQNRGFSFSALRGLNAAPTASAPAPGFFDTVSYKGRDFVKYYAYDAPTNQVAADPDLGVTTIADATKATALVSITNAATRERAPYVVRAGNFWYVADMPFSYIGPRDRYLVIADLLHDMMGIPHAESHQAMVRLEDVDAKVSVPAMKKLSDYLFGKHVPFSIALIPHYKDPLGLANDGTPEDIPLAQATSLRTAVNYAIARGAQLVMHGYTHQYAAQKNPWSGISGDDYEFWDIVHNAPVPEDSTAWALGRLNAGLAEMQASGYSPVAWETPHYFASSLASKAVPQVFSTTYQRVVYLTSDRPDFSPHPGKDFAAGQIFPYVIQRDYYGQRVLPESLGNIEYDISNVDPSSYFNYSWQEIYGNAQYALTVRDGFASFFFHPFWLEAAVGQPGFQDFTSLVEAITALGYTWVAPASVQ
ncbi:DUF2334 domain-containing protein [Ramlibacter sp.]|uniref:DUF2334 domain-containing protein n=1 Tax=Ramlibacter sp. TaxID=1917967 RepID=UPI0026379D7A|nr:DUF2334 domain-containing protein [Ramlibacter sp.]MDB5956899.1 papd-like protein [Ramlibacter sp.]